MNLPFPKFPTFSLKARLNIGVIAIVLCATLGLTTMALHLVKRNMQEAIAAEQFQRISAIADAIDQKFVGRRILLRTFSTSVETQKFKVSAQLQDFLIAHHSSLKENFDNVAFFDIKGNLVANLNGKQQIGKVNVADRQYFMETLAQKKGVISQPYRNRTSGLAQIALTQPVLDEFGEVKWMISGVINLKEENFLGELARVKFGKTGYMFITNTNGIVIDHPRKNRILNHSDAEGGRNVATTRAIAGFEGTTDAMNRVGVYGLYAFKQTKQTNWVLGSIYPRGEAFAEIDRIERFAWAGAFVLAVIAGGLALFVLRSQLKPLSELHDHMQRSRTEDAYVARDSVPSPPEIRDMAETFDSLMRERQSVQEQLRSRQAHLHNILTHAPDAFISIDSTGLITEWNQQAEITFGWNKAEVLGRNLAQLLIPAAMRRAHDDGLAKFVHTGEGPVINKRIEVPALHRDGHEIPVELSVASIRQGDLYVANAFLRDITDRRLAQSQLAASEKRVRDIADHVPALIGYFTADLQMQFANGPARRIFNLDPAQSYEMRVALGEDRFLQYAPHLPAVLAGQEVSFNETSLKAKDSVYQAHLVPNMTETNEVIGFYMMTFDISEFKYAEMQLLELSHVDTLTRLPNRRSFLQKLDEALGRSKRDGRAMALMYIDVDSFKQINDAHGHGVGDEVLIEFAERLQNAVRETDTVARLGGDEFVIIIEGLGSGIEAEHVARKVVAAMQPPMILKNSQLIVTASIGVAAVEAAEDVHDSALARLGHMTAEELIDRADKALYEAKRAGRNTYASFDA